jgi:hypothetical protein
MIGSLAHVLLSVDLYRYPRETGRKAEMGVRVGVGRTNVVIVLEGIARGAATVRRDMIVRVARDAILTEVYIYILVRVKIVMEVEAEEAMIRILGDPAE